MFSREWYDQVRRSHNLLWNVVGISLSIGVPLGGAFLNSDNALSGTNYAAETLRLVFTRNDEGVGAQQ